MFGFAAGIIAQGADRRPCGACNAFEAPGECVAAVQAFARCPTARPDAMQDQFWAPVRSIAISMR
jgi:hypothetical protein